MSEPSQRLLQLQADVNVLKSEITSIKQMIQGMEQALARYPTQEDLSTVVTAQAALSETIERQAQDIARVLSELNPEEMVEEEFGELRGGQVIRNGDNS